MKFRRLQPVCECGRAAQSFLALGFSSEYELVIHWICQPCGKHAYIVKPLSQCCKEVPDAGDPGLISVREGRQDTHAADRRFLQSTGIRP